MELCRTLSWPPRGSHTPDEKAPSTPTRLLAMDSAPGRVEFEPTYLQVPKLAAVPSEAQSTSSSQELLTYPAKFGLKAQTTLIRRKTGADVFSAEKEAHEVGLLQAACDYLNKKHPQAGGKGLGPRVALSDVKLRVHRGRPLVLGEGAFGKVYLGRMFGKDCAVKTICEGTRKEQARFLREIRILETLRTEHVVKYMGWSVCPEGLVMLMEYCPGGNLTQALAKHESDYQYYKRGKDAMLSIASALIHLHDQSIAHLDIKSLNVLIAGGGSVKLADVGLSRLVKNERTVLSGPNTYAWASPEQLENFAGTAADIWSFGTTLWEVCTCEKPPSNRILRHIEVDEEAPKEVVDLINDCHEADWQKRLTAHQLFARLKACPWKRFQFET